MSDPFRHHPELRDRIVPAGQSTFRELDLAQVDAHAAANGMAPDWRTPDALREAGRREVLEDRWERDLWVFAYGSLMWDPAMEFEEVRRAHTPSYARDFCLWDEGARGSVEHPGLMLAISQGDGCSGLAFRIAADRLDRETFVLFRREMIADAYVPTWLELETDQGPVEALSFAARTGHARIRPGLGLEVQASMIALASGFLGSNLDYLNGVQAQLHELGLEDAYVQALHARTHEILAR